MKIKEEKQHGKGRIKAVELGREDKAILHAIEPIVEGIAKLFGSNCEVALHSLKDPGHSIIKIENGHVTGRKIGSSLTDFGIKVLEDENSLKSNVIGSYYTKTKDGRTLKSITVLIRNDKEKPIGFLCINVDLSVSLINLLQNLLPSPGITVKETKHFTTSVQELVEEVLDEAISKINKDKSIPNSKKNKLIAFELYNKGIFDIRGAVDIVAQKMGISRYSVYNYIREARVRLSLAHSKKEY